VRYDPLYGPLGVKGLIGNTHTLLYPVVRLSTNPAQQAAHHLTFAAQLLQSVPHVQNVYRQTSTEASRVQKSLQNASPQDAACFVSPLRRLEF